MRTIGPINLSEEATPLHACSAHTLRVRAMCIGNLSEEAIPLYAFSAQCEPAHVQTRIRYCLGECNAFIMLVQLRNKSAHAHIVL